MRKSTHLYPLLTYYSCFPSNISHSSLRDLSYLFSLHILFLCDREGTARFYRNYFFYLPNNNDYSLKHLSSRAAEPLSVLHGRVSRHWFCAFKPLTRKR